MTYFRADVNPSMSPSRAQLRRSPSRARSPHPPWSTRWSSVGFALLQFQSVAHNGMFALIESYYALKVNITGQWVSCSYHDQRSQGWRSPESGQDDPLREKRYEQGTPCAYRPCYFAVLKTLSLCIPYFELRCCRWRGQLIQGLPVESSNRCGQAACAAKAAVGLALLRCRSDMQMYICLGQQSAGRSFIYGRQSQSCWHHCRPKVATYITNAVKQSSLSESAVNPPVPWQPCGSAAPVLD